MAKRIEWSDKALDRLSQALKYLKFEVSHAAAVNFAELIDKRVEFIEKHPTSGRKVANRKTIRFVLVGKYYRLYYRVHGSVLYITALFDTRQDPSKRPY
jgi:plasmid stabilization system protein ParE